MRYVGEPVAVVVAPTATCAEDAVDLIEVDYRPLPAVVDPLARARSRRAACCTMAFPAISPASARFRYGDPEQAFAEAPHRIAIDVRYPRNSCTPIETYGVVAEYDAGRGRLSMCSPISRARSASMR